MTFCFSIPALFDKPSVRVQRYKVKWKRKIELFKHTYRKVYTSEHGSSAIKRRKRPNGAEGWPLDMRARVHILAISVREWLLSWELFFLVLVLSDIVSSFYDVSTLVRETKDRRKKKTFYRFDSCTRTKLRTNENALCSLTPKGPLLFGSCFVGKDTYWSVGIPTRHCEYWNNRERDCRTFCTLRSRVISLPSDKLLFVRRLI